MKLQFTLRNLFFGLLILLIAGPFIGQVFPESDLKDVEKDSVGIVIAKSGLILRSRPSVDSRPLTLLPYGSHVQLLKETRDYASVNGMNARWMVAKFGNQVGWIFGARELIIQTTIIGKELFVSLPDGLDIREGLSMDSPVLLHLPHGAVVKQLTDEFQVLDDKKNARLWAYVEALGRNGYAFSRSLSSVVYTKEQLENGPFEGMVLKGLPDTYSMGTWGIVGKSEGFPEDIYSFGILMFKDTRYIVLIKDGMIAQIVVDPGDVFPDGMALILSNAHSVYLNCYSSGGTLFPLALIDYPPAKKKYKIDSEGNTTYYNLVRKVWLFDARKERLVESDPPQGSECFAPNPRMFD